MYKMNTIKYNNAAAVVFKSKLNFINLRLV